jgi:hypothetical protein
MAYVKARIRRNWSGVKPELRLQSNQFVWNAKNTYRRPVLDGAGLNASIVKIQNKIEKCTCPDKARKLASLLERQVLKAQLVQHQLVR